MSWLQDHGWVVGVIVAAALALAGLAWWFARRRPATSVPGAAARRRVDLVFAATVLITLAVGWTAVLWLLGKADELPPGKDRAAAQADAIKTGATIALGTGGAAYLLLAYRRQRLDEVDTRARRITELYTSAVEQLGHEKAPVRLGALYSLERLAQDNPVHRQTVVDVVCAYLRMPYTPPPRIPPRPQAVTPAAAPANEWEEPPFLVRRQDPAREELQVRQTAQHILAAHLNHPAPGIPSSGTGQRRPPPRRLIASSRFARAQAHAAAKAQRRGPSSQRTFWPGISLNLTGAALVEFDFTRVSVVQARFDAATFHGSASFIGATFQDSASFTGADFQGSASFYGATFQGDAWFNGATFQGSAWFTEADFKNAVWFEEAIFHGSAWFLVASFQSPGEAEGIAGARVLRLNDPDPYLRRLWPDGYTVRPDPTDSTRGTLVNVQHAEEPEPAVPPSDQAGP